MTVVSFLEPPFFSKYRYEKPIQKLFKVGGRPYALYSRCPNFFTINRLSKTPYNFLRFVWWSAMRRAPRAARALASRVARGSQRIASGAQNIIFKMCGFHSGYFNDDPAAPRRHLGRVRYDTAYLGTYRSLYFHAR
jgi:hypothetical protein